MTRCDNVQFKADWIADAMDNGYSRAQAEHSFQLQGYEGFDASGNVRVEQ